MHNLKVEAQGKCRRLFFLKVDGEIPLDDAGQPVPDEQPKAGDVIGVASGGGALEDLTGDDLIISTFNDQAAPQRIGCIEEFFNPIPVAKPLKVDLVRVQDCQDAVAAHRLAVKAEADFVFEKGIKLFGSEQTTTKALQHILKVQEMHTRNDSGRVSDHDAIIQAQTDLEALSNTCDDCCEQVLITRDAAITFAGPVA